MNFPAATAQPDKPLPAQNPPTHHEKKKHRTVGNHIYDVGIYGSTAWAGVAAMSAISAHEANHGTNPWFNWWRKVNDKFTGGMTKVFSKIVKPENVHGYARGTAMFLTLGMGGMILMAPLRWMEAYREKNAAHIDKALGTSPVDPETIEPEPKQTWKSVLSGRFFSWGMSYAAFIAMGPKLTGKIQQGVGEKVTNFWMKRFPESNRAKVKQWADLGAFDAVFTAITAGLTFVFSRFVAKRNDERFHPHQDASSQDEAHPEIPVPTLQPSPAGTTPESTEQAAAKEPQRDHGKERKFVSAGEKIHHWSTYLSVDWIYNAAAGAAFAYWGKFTPMGRKYWSKPLNKGFETVLKPFLKNPEHLKEGVKQGNTFMSIIAGGMLTIPPLLVLENNKVKTSTAKFIDRIIYGKDKVEHDPKFQQAYDELEHAPKKDFWTGMTSRFTALAPLLLSVLIPPSGRWLKKNLFSPVGNASKAVVSAVGLPPSRMFKKFSDRPAKWTEKRWNYIHDDAIAMDLSFGLPYAVLHSFFYNKFASRKKDREDAASHTQPQVTAPIVEQTPEPVAETEKKSFAEGLKPPEEKLKAEVSKRPGSFRDAVTPRTEFKDYAQPSTAEAQTAV